MLPTARPGPCNEGSLQSSLETSIITVNNKLDLQHSAFIHYFRLILGRLTSHGAWPRKTICQRRALAEIGEGRPPGKRTRHFAQLQNGNMEPEASRGILQPEFSDLTELAAMQSVSLVPDMLRLRCIFKSKPHASKISIFVCMREEPCRSMSIRVCPKEYSTTDNKLRLGSACLG